MIKKELGERERERERESKSESESESGEHADREADQ